MHNHTSTFITIEKNAEVPVLFSITFAKQKKEIVHKMPFLISGFRVATSFLYTLSALFPGTLISP